MKTSVKVLIAVLLAADVLLAAVIFGPFEGSRKDQPALKDAAVFAPTQIPVTTETDAVPETGETLQTQPADPVPQTPPDEEFSLTFVGDCTFGAPVSAYYAPLGFIKTVGDDLSYPFKYVVSYFEEDDFTMVNLEGVLADQGAAIPKEHNFRGPARFAKILSQNSVEAVTLANNHTFDYGKKGYQATMSALETENVPYVEADGILLVETERGLKIGIYAMTYATMNEADMREGIAALKEQGAELIIVAAHWGRELRYEPIDDQLRLGHAAIDAGAHIVYGSHPHVLQPIEVYGNGIIYYSLGNFSFGGNGNPKDYDTAIVRQQVIRKSDGTIVLGDCTPIPACVSSVSGKNNYQPIPYEEGSTEYERAMSKLNYPFE